MCSCGACVCVQLYSLFCIQVCMLYKCVAVQAVYVYSCASCICAACTSTACLTSYVHCTARYLLSVHVVMAVHAVWLYMLYGCTCCMAVHLPYRLGVSAASMATGCLGIGFVYTHTHTHTDTRRHTHTHTLNDGWRFKKLTF